MKLIDCMIKSLPEPLRADNRRFDAKIDPYFVVLRSIFFSIKQQHNYKYVEYEVSLSREGPVGNNCVTPFIQCMYSAFILFFSLIAFPYCLRPDKIDNI